jgi:hypothetical protein
MKAAYDKVLSETGKVALQYGPTDGYAPLREWIANSLSTSSTKIVPEQILMTSGSQQALDLIGKVLIDEGSRVLVERYPPRSPMSSAAAPPAHACCIRCRTSRTRPAARCRWRAAANWSPPVPAWACR